MMEALRNGAKSWVAKALLAILVLSFGIWGIQDTFRGFQAADIAEVGGRGIASETFRVELNRSLQNLQRQTGGKLSLEDARKFGLDKQVLDRLIGTAALQSLGDRLDVQISEEYIKSRVMENPAFRNSSGKFDPAVLKSILAQNGLSEAGYVADQKNAQLRASLTGIASDNIALPKTLLDAMLRYRDETRDGRYFTITVSESDVPTPTDNDLKKQYDSAPAAYTAPEYRGIAVMKIEPGDIASKIEITDQEITESYELNKLDYFSTEKRDIIQLSFPDLKAAEAAKARLDKGEDIIALATSLAMKESDILFKDSVKETFLDAKIGEAAFALKEGAVSAPVQGSLNTVLLKAAKVTPDKQATLDESKAAVRQKIQLEKARDEIQSIYDAVEDARAQSAKFEDIAAKVGIPLTVVPSINAVGLDKAGVDVVLPNKDEVLKAAFEGDPGVETDPMNFGDGYVWYEIREVVPPLAEIKDVVKADWVAEKLRTIAGEKAKAIVDKAAGNTRLDTLATEMNAKILSVSGIKRNQTSEAFDGISALALFSAPANTLTWALEGDGKSARIIEVSKVTPPASVAESKELKDTARNGLGGDLLQGYLAAVREGTKVTVNDELWRKISGPSNTP
jgi:peptidyl-prolyl cis-trans isomerase D